METADRQRAQALGQTILNAVAGEKSPIAVLAVTDALATLIGWGHHVTGKSVHTALETAGACSERIEEHILHNWGKIERGGRDG